MKVRILPSIALLFCIIALFSSFFFFPNAFHISRAQSDGPDRLPASIDESAMMQIVRNDGQYLSIRFASHLPDDLHFVLRRPGGGLGTHRLIGPSETIRIGIEESGVYTAEIYSMIEYKIYESYMDTWMRAAGENILWRQLIFVQADKDFTVDESTIASIAQKYSPVVLLHEREKFLPSSLEYIFNLIDIDETLKNEEFQVSFDRARYIVGKERNNIESRKKIAFKFEDISSALSQFGADDSLLDIGTWQKIKSVIQRRYGRPEYATIYYCYFERDRKLYLRYYFFYSFDPKNVSFNPVVTHIFDRESYTMVYDLDRDQPDYLVYSSHLLNQTIGLGDEKKRNFKKWKGGKLYLNWDEVPKIEDRPIISIAEGSHAVYPFPGNYGVFPVGAVIRLVEEAGGDKRILVPRGDQYHSMGSTKIYPYHLQDLQIGKISSESWNRMLGFSGKFVDIFSIPFLSQNLNFPPFTERETDIFNYASREQTYHFDLQVLPPSSSRVISKVQQGLKRITIPNIE